MSALVPRDALYRIDVAADTTLRIRMDSRFTARCIERVREDSAGTAIFPVAMMARDGNRYIRELNEATIHQLPQDRTTPVWLLRRSPEDGGKYILRRLDSDSLRNAWGTR